MSTIIQYGDHINHPDRAELQLDTRSEIDQLGTVDTEGTHTDSLLSRCMPEGSEVLVLEDSSVWRLSKRFGWKELE